MSDIEKNIQKTNRFCKFKQFSTRDLKDMFHLIQCQKGILEIKYEMICDILKERSEQ